MTRKNKILFILSVFVILAPTVFGLIAWNALLPHFAMMKGFMLATVVFLPLLFLLLHILCVGFTLRDYKKKGQSEKIVTLAICILPAIALFAFCITYALILGEGAQKAFLSVYILLGGALILTGNYMPKARRNRTFGLKNVWTLASDEVWARTHRLAGKISVIVGVLLLLCVFLPQSVTLLIASIFTAVFALAFIPSVYSYVIYKKAVEEGKLPPKAELKKSDKIARAVSIPLVVIVLIGAAVLCLTGSISFTLGEDALSVEATYWKDTAISYESIASAELVSDMDAARVSGFGSPVLSLGLFKSEKVGTHTHLAYTDAELHIVLTLKDGGKIVLGAKTAEETTALYEGLIENIS